MKRTRRDANEKEIVNALLAAGAQVSRILASDIPGCPDLSVSFNELWHALEVKDKNGRLSQSQKDFIASAKAPVHVVHTPEEALSAIGAME